MLPRRELHTGLVLSGPQRPLNRDQPGSGLGHAHASGQARANGRPRPHARLLEDEREAAEAVPGMEERLKVRIDPSAEDAVTAATE